MISEDILIPKIYARLQEIPSNFLKFLGGGPPDPLPAVALSVLGSGLRPLTGPTPFPKYLDLPLQGTMKTPVRMLKTSGGL